MRWHSYLSFLFIALVLFGFLAIPSYAQENGQDGAEQNSGMTQNELMQLFGDQMVETMRERRKQNKDTFKPKDDKMLEIPTEYIDEAIAYRMVCENDVARKTYYNCECLGVKFLDRRVEVGDDYTRRSIAQDIESECKEGTNVAGMKYKQCMTHYIRPGYGQDYEKFCACYGSEYGKIYENFRGSVSAKDHMNIRTAAVLTCRNKKDL